MRSIVKAWSNANRSRVMLIVMAVVLLGGALMLSSCASREKSGTARFMSRPTASGPAMPPGGLGAGAPMAGPMGPPAGAGMPGDVGVAQTRVAPAKSANSSQAQMPSLEGDSSFPSVPPTDSFLLIIKTANVTLKVKNIEMAGDQITAIAKSVGGYVTDSSFNRSEDEETPPHGTMTIRVPTNAFERVVAQVGEFGEVMAKNLSGEDVSGQVVDLESRLRNKRAEEAQYAAIMRQTKKIQDIVSVSNQLFEVRGEIEQLQGRIKYLRSASDMSTITITLTEPRAETEKGIPGVWQRALDSLRGSGDALLSWLIWIAVFAPFWVAALILLWVLVRLVRKRLA